jgi:hypothetical protein
MSDSPSGKRADGNSVMWGTRLQPMAFSTNLGCFKKHSSAHEWRTEKIMWIVFISILCAGNGLTPGIFVYCTCTLMGCCEGKWSWRLKIIREFLDQTTHCRHTYGQKVTMGIGVCNLQSKASSLSQTNFKTYKQDHNGDWERSNDL